MYKIHRHYDEVRSQLTLEGAKIPDPIRRHKVVIPVGDLHRGVLPALRYAKSLSGDVVAVAVEIDPRRTQALKEKWERWGKRVPARLSGSLAAVSTLFVTVGVLFGAALIRGWPQAVVAVLGLSLVVLLATLAFVLIIQSFLA